MTQFSKDLNISLIDNMLSRKYLFFIENRLVLFNTSLIASFSVAYLKI